MDIQEIIVFALFAAVVVYAAFRFFRKPKSDGCASCDFNADNQ